MDSLILLSIVVVTMNRREQLIEALQSCLQSKLPNKTEIIIIDNHSTDGTDEAVENLFVDKNIVYTYKYLEKNKGAGGGRNEGFLLAKGKYIYFLDDDAVISQESRDLFFIKSINLLENNSNVATLTTRIWDEMLETDRVVNVSKLKKVSGYDTISMLLGGSNFVRASAFKYPLYPDFRYGYEEIIPSFVAIDKGMYNIYFAEVSVVHRPKMNKWKKGSSQAIDTISKENAGLLASKYLLYPSIFKPLIFAAFLARWYIHLRDHKGAFQESLRIFSDQTRGVKIKKIKYRTVLKIFREFGFGAGV
ncbi:glycosyltransferase family 2 protein [Paenibacillus sp. GCM10012303]|uniref:glycosyltransferase family 2 protein n=1 Tax=Paenibacillus sp. GCM10012303 TaxID=3317340 RepID=UPI00362311A5